MQDTYVEQYERRQMRAQFAMLLLIAAEIRYEQENA